MQGKLRNFRTDSQCHKVLEYLKTGKTLTCLDAIRLGLTHNLKSRICDIKDAGHKIHTDYIHVNKTYIARYSLVMDGE